jgi:hypothetical protein
MPRKLTVECTCDRCGRIWYLDYKEGEELPATPYLELKLQVPGSPEQDQEVKFEMLCSSCSKTISNYVSKLGELQHRSPNKSGAKEEPEDTDSSSKKQPKPRLRRSKSDASSAS